MKQLLLLNETWLLGYCSDDPVRPELSIDFRTSSGREVYALEDEDTGVIDGIVCVAYTNEVPTTVHELDYFSQSACQGGEHGNHAIFYTIWSYTPGAGRELINVLWDYLKENKPVNRFVTLSPRTEMARKFHTRNGAFELQDNIETTNYEYSETS
jgi:hypothetical protein